MRVRGSASFGRSRRNADAGAPNGASVAGVRVVLVPIAPKGVMASGSSELSCAPHTFGPDLSLVTGGQVSAQLAGQSSVRLSKDNQLYIWRQRWSALRLSWAHSSSRRSVNYRLSRRLDDFGRHVATTILDVTS